MELLLEYLLLADYLPVPLKVPGMGLLAALPFILVWVMLTKLFEDILS